MNNQKFAVKAITTVLATNSAALIILIKNLID